MNSKLDSEQFVNPNGISLPISSYSLEVYHANTSLVNNLKQEESPEQRYSNFKFLNAPATKAATSTRTTSTAPTTNFLRNSNARTKCSSASLKT